MQRVIQVDGADEHLNDGGLDRTRHVGQRQLRRTSSDQAKQSITDHGNCEVGPVPSASIDCATG